MSVLTIRGTECGLIELGQVANITGGEVQHICYHTYSVPLRTGTCYIRGIFVLYLQDYCALQELLMKMNFTLAVASPFVHPMMSLPATPTHSDRKYGFFSEPTQWRQVET